MALEYFRGKLGKAITLASLLSLPLISSCISKKYKTIPVISNSYESRLEYKLDPFKDIIDSYSERSGLGKDLLKSVLAADIEHISLEYLLDKDTFAKDHLDNFHGAKSNPENKTDKDVFADYLGNYGISDDGEIDSYINKVFSFENSFGVNGLAQLLSGNKTESPGLDKDLLSQEQEGSTDEKLEPYLEDILKYSKDRNLNPNLLKAKVAVDLASINPSEISDINRFIEKEADELKTLLRISNGDKYSALALNYTDYESLSDIIEGSGNLITTIHDIFYDSDPLCFFDRLPELNDGNLIKQYLESVLKYELAFHIPDSSTQASYSVYIIDPGHGYNPSNGPYALYDDDGSLFDGEVDTSKTKGKTKYYKKGTRDRLWKGDPGARWGSLNEDDLTYAVGSAVAELLEKETSSKVVMTRRKDQFVSLPHRVNVAKGYSPENSLFLSIHFDYSPNKGTNGCRGFYNYGLDNEVGRWLRNNKGNGFLNGLANLFGLDLTKVSYNLTPGQLRNIHRRTQKILSGLDSLGLEKRGLAADKEWSSHEFYVLKGLKDRPAMLIETGFMGGDYKINKTILYDPYFSMHIGQAFVNGLK